MDLLALLKTIDQFRRAPGTPKAPYPKRSSPYQPVLMLAIVRRFQNSKVPVTTPVIQYEDCKEEFRTIYESLLTQIDEAKFGPMVTQPFWVFGSGRSIPNIWNLRPRAGKGEELGKVMETGRDPLKTESRLVQLVEHAELVDGLLDVLNDSVARQVINRFVCDRYFPDPHAVLSSD